MPQHIVKLRCRVCSTEFTSILPDPEILNSPKICVVGFAVKPVSCPNPKCLAVMVPAIHSVNMKYIWVNMPKEAEQSAIVMPGG